MKPIKTDEAISWDELVRLTPKTPEQPILPLEAEKRRAEKPNKAPPASPKGNHTLENEQHVRR